MAAVTASFVKAGTQDDLSTELWNYTSSFTAGTDTVNAITPKRIRRVVFVEGNFGAYSVSGYAYTFTFGSNVSKPWVKFYGY